jgi:hypothetical protein
MGDDQNETFGQVLGRKISYRNPSLPRFIWVSLREGRPLGMTLVIAWLYRQTRNGMSAQVGGDVQRLLGRPLITLRQYVEDYRSYWA